MFKFFFKRSAATPAAERQTEPAVPAQDSARKAREAALAGAEEVAAEERAAPAFILQCEFAEARLKAAQQVRSRPLLEQLAQAMRNTDRRVARLAQQRLEALAAQEAAEGRGQACVEQAARLAREPHLLASQVAELDRAWGKAGKADEGAEVSAATRERFDAERATLAARLQAQAGLQRTLLDAAARLRRLAQEAAAIPAVREPARLRQELAAMAEQATAWRAHPEAASLPRNLLADFERDQAGAQEALSLLEGRMAAMAAHEAALAGWEAAAPSDLQEDAVERAWQALPALDGGLAAPFAARHAALLARMRAARPRTAPVPETGKAPRKRKPVAGPAAEALLAAMEQALEEGALQAGIEDERGLRALGPSGSWLPGAQGARLARLRAELARLQGWARWGGQVSREELQKAAEALQGEDIAPPELAKKVGSLRARWKALDAVAGAAGREAWERFDAACGAAYAPPAAHFKKPAQERLDNLAKAHAQIAQVEEFAAASGVQDDPEAVDWKAVAAFCERATQAWQRLGPIERKERKRLDGQFAAALQVLGAPLAGRREAEIARREQMIEETAALDPADRHAAAVLQAIQERWQRSSRELPLARHDEQALWQRFRAACDALFAQRKEAARQADTDRGRHLEQKEALCAELEAAREGPIEAIPPLLRGHGQAWERIGPVPRAAEQRIGQRRQAAIAALQERLEQAGRAARSRQARALGDRLTLCQSLEARLAQGGAADAGLEEAVREQWRALPESEAGLDRILAGRLEAALAAAQADRAAYARQLEDNRGALLQDVLRLEILCGRDSPPDLARERLQLQVEVLQASLQAGRAQLTRAALLERICALPALADAATAARLATLLEPAL